MTKQEVITSLDYTILCVENDLVKHEFAALVGLVRTTLGKTITFIEQLDEPPTKPCHFCCTEKEPTARFRADYSYGYIDIPLYYCPNCGRKL